MFVLEALDIATTSNEGIWQSFNSYTRSLILFGSAFIFDFEGMNSLGFEMVLWRSLDEPELKSSSEESLPKIIFSRAFFGV